MLHSELIRVASEVLHIKTPQLIGIIAGCIVFTITISVVFYLLYASGTTTRFIEELKSNQQPSNVAKTKQASHQHQDFPKIYDYLLNAAKILPIKPNPPIIQGKNIVVRQLIDEDLPNLVAVSNGDAIFGESAYNPARIWGWMEVALNQPKFEEMNEDVELSEKNSSLKKLIWPSESTSLFHSTFSCDEKSVNLVIMDKELDTPVGMLSLLDNNPEHLAVRIGNIWLSPAYQGKKIAHEAMFYVLGFLFTQGYRRVTAELDARHLLYRKFLERCHFKLEAVLRKHKIVCQRNRDTALYVLLNSEFDEATKGFQRLLGIGKGDGVRAVDFGQSAQTTKTANGPTSKLEREAKEQLINNTQKSVRDRTMMSKRKKDKSNKNKKNK